MSQFTMFAGSTSGLIFSLIAAGLGVYLLVFHLTHLGFLVPYLFLIACPLMHMMHRGNHSHHGSDKQK